jgi:hypothetical protein
VLVVGVEEVKCIAAIYTYTASSTYTCRSSQELLNLKSTPVELQLLPTTNMDLSESQTTFPSDSEVYDANYDANHSNSQDSEEQTSHSSSPLILYSPPTFLSILRGAAINLVLPFVNGLMLGFGELFAHEAAFRLGWGGTRVRIAFCYQKRRVCRRNSCSRSLSFEGTELGRGLRSGLTHCEQIFPGHRNSRTMGPGVEIKDDPIERRRRSGREMDAYTSME